MSTKDIDDDDDVVARKPYVSSDDDDDDTSDRVKVFSLRRRRSSNYEPPPPTDLPPSPPRRRKRVRFVDDDEDDEEDEVAVKLSRKNNVDEEEEEPSVPEDAKPIGEVVRVSGKGRGLKKHFKMFEFDGNRFRLEDPVLLSPEDKGQKPYIAIIKDITQSRDGSVMVTGQWFYRPKEAEKSKGGNWEARDTRELFYSFHCDDVPAESVMHKCVVHFVPLHKQIPNRKQYPGFIIQKVYDPEEKKLYKLTDKDYKDGKQEEIDIMVRKTISRLGELPNIETEATPLEDQTRSKRLLKKRSISTLDVSKEDEWPLKSPTLETPGSCLDNASRHTTILAEAKVLTKDSTRDRWLERLLQVVEYVCSPAVNLEERNKGDEGNSGKKSTKLKSSLTWPDSAVSAVVALEKASHEAFSLDYQKYNQKCRSLWFNLKSNELLAQRLLNGELEPSKILSMQPNELRAALTQEEITRNQPEELAKMQMTDARCKRCNEKKVGVVEIIHAGHGDRYQLECTACGNSWYASRDAVTMLTIGPSAPTNVGSAPWATSKFETLEKKKALSPRDMDKPDTTKKDLQGRSNVNS